MGIKSFRAPQKQQSKKSEQAILVSDYMTKKLITFKADQPVLEVMDVLIKNRISGGPVVNAKGELVGIISEGDCMKQISESRYFNMPMNDTIVENHMVKNVDTINESMNIFDVATLFYKSNRKRFPVLRNGKLVGQISRRDVLKAALEQKGATW